MQLPNWYGLLGLPRESERNVKAKTVKLATASTVERIEKYVNEYAFSTNYRVNHETLEITNTGRDVPTAWFVERCRGGFIFGRRVS